MFGLTVEYMNCTLHMKSHGSSKLVRWSSIPVHWSIIPELRSSQLTIHAYKLCGETLAWLMATRRQSRVRRAHCWALLLLVGVPSRSARSPICLSYVICICKLPQPAYGCGGGIYMGMEWYGSVPIHTILNGMNIHKSQLFWCELQGYKVLTHCHIILYTLLLPTNWDSRYSTWPLTGMWRHSAELRSAGLVQDLVWCRCPHEKKNNRHHETS